MPQLAPAVSTLARQTMRMAFEDLERTMTPADARDSRTTTLQQVRAAALQIESQLAAQQKLRNMRRLTPLLNGLEHYANVVDVLCNGTPFLSWIWSPITLILRIASEYIEAFEEIMKGYRKIAESLGRFEILSDAFIADADFQQTLAVFYADILQFHKYAYRFVRRSGWKLLFITSWGRFQRRFDTILEDMNRHGTLIDQEANARNIAEARQMRHDIRNWREESLDQVKRDEEELASTQYRAIMSWLKIDDTEQLSIFETIWQEGTKYPGTCDWILKTQKLKSWLQRKQDTPFIWLQGNPGSGKSVISTQLVNFIQASNSRVIRHFCTYSYASSTKYDCILRSLLLQLLRTNGELVAHVYRECVLTRRSPTISTLEQLLHSLISTLSDEPRENEYIWIILDGVDECETEKQSRLVSLMNQVTGKSSSHGGTVCKVLISSRSSPLMDRCLRKKQVVSLSDEVVRVEKAIQAYASQRLRSLHERFRQLELETEDIDEIEQIIAKKAHGMFLYARLVLDYISTNIFYSGDELKESINQLPQTLADFYHKILTQILSHLDLRSVDRVRSILGWIAFSKRPLKKLEFLSALTFSSGDATVGRLAPRYILDICSPLIEERRDTTLGFIHVSVKEFLQSCQNGVAITQHEALREHGLATVTCLLAGLQVFNAAYNEQTRLLRLVKGVHGFHIYATEYWTEYLLNEGATSGGLDPTSSLCTLATQLTSKLEGTVSSTALTHIKDNAATLDERLKYLHNHEILRRHVECALLSRSRKRLESEVLLNDKQGIKRAKPASTSSILDGISVMLEVYQQAVEYLLNQDSCPGASAEELDCFKSQFRASAYTCRLRSCPRATVGFETERLRQEHEVAHTGGFRCSFPTCQYPPLKSSQALQMHVDKYHNPKPVRKTIRRMARTEFRSLPKSHTTQEQSNKRKRNQEADVILPTKENITGKDIENPVAIPSDIRCICGYLDDDGDTVLCEQCDTWQHIVCYYESTQSVPEIHKCVYCLPRLMDVEGAFQKQQRRRELRGIIGPKGKAKSPVKVATKASTSEGLRLRCYCDIITSLALWPQDGVIKCASPACLRRDFHVLCVVERHGNLIQPWFCDDCILSRGVDILEPHEKVSQRRGDPLATSPGQVSARTPQQQVDMPPLSDIQVTSQELQVFRQRLQPYHADTTDDQLRQIIMDQKTNMARRQQLNNLQTATYPTTRLSPKPFSTGKEDTAILTDLVEEVMPTVEEVAAHRSYYTRHAKVESTLKSLELPPRYLSPAPTRQKDQTSKIRDRKQESSPASSANNTMTMNGQRPIKSNFLPGPSQLPRPITSQTTGTQLPPLALATPDIPSLPSFTEMEKLPPLLDSDSLDQKDHSDDQDAGAADHRTVNRSRNPRREPTQYSLYIPTQDYAHDPRYTVPEAAPVPPSGTDAVRTNHIQDTLVNKDPNGTPPGWWTLNQGEEVMSRSMTRKEWMLHQAPQMGPMGNNPQMSRQRGQIPTNTTLSTQTKPELVPNTHALSHLQPQHRLLSTPSIPPIREEVPPPLPPPHALGKASGMGQDPGGQWGNTTSPNDFGNGFNGSRRLASMKPESGYLSMEGRDHEFWGQQQSLQQPDALPPLKDYNPWQAQQSRLSREMTVQESYVTYHATPENTQFVDPRMSTTLERDRISRAESRRRMTERMPPPPGLTHEQWQQQEDEALQRQINRQIPRQQRRRLKQQQQQQVTQAQQRIEILPSYSSMEYSPRLPPPGI